MVKGQKETRKNNPKKVSNDEHSGKTPKINNNIVLLEKKTGKFEAIIGLIDEKGEESLPLYSLVKSKILEEYGNTDTPLNFVAITDGAKNIRMTLFAIFGLTITIILDWYHLCKKLGEYMSMIARNKKEKTEYLKFLLSNLWCGRTQEALNYLKTHVPSKNEQKLQELIIYLEKHQDEIIDYDRRSKVGKKIGPSESISMDTRPNIQPLEGELLEEQPITYPSMVKKVLGSGRVEKACDQIIGIRQKNKAMSWSKKGSRSLGLLKVEELNNRWEALWFPKQPAIYDYQLDNVHSKRRVACQQIDMSGGLFV